MPTPAPVEAVTVAEVLNSGVAIIQTFGLMAFITFGALVGAAVMLYRRFRSASR